MTDWLSRFFNFLKKEVALGNLYTHRNCWEENNSHNAPKVYF